MPPRPRADASVDLARARASADDVSHRLSDTRARTVQAVELAERALREFRDADARDASKPRSTLVSPYDGEEDEEGGDNELTALVRQLESFAEKRTGTGQAPRGANGTSGTTRGERERERERGGDKWSVKSGDSGDGRSMNDENSLVGYSMMYGSTVDDDGSVADADELASEFSVDFSLPSERVAGGATARNDKKSELGSVSGRINAVSDSLTTSKARLHESIASLDLEAGLTENGAEMDFEQYKDDMPVVGNTKTGQVVIDLAARGVNSLSRSSSQFMGEGKGGRDGDGAELSPLVRMFNSVCGGCCALRK